MKNKMKRNRKKKQEKIRKTKQNKTKILSYRNCSEACQDTKYLFSRNMIANPYWTHCNVLTIPPYCLMSWRTH